MARTVRSATSGSLMVLLVLAALASGPARAADVTVPVDLGIAPALHRFSGPIAADQAWHYGLRLSVEAVIDQKTLKSQRQRVPAKYRKYIDQANEVRIRPLWWLPSTLFLSPKRERTQIWGLVLRPIGVGLSVDSIVRISASAGAIATYAFIDSSSLLDDAMHFLRPGLEGRLDFELPLSDSLLLSAGWASMVHVPQRLGASLMDFDDLQRAGSVWHVGQAYVMAHIRFPYTTSL